MNCRSAGANCLESTFEEYVGAFGILEKSVKYKIGAKRRKKIENVENNELPAKVNWMNWINWIKWI